MPYQDFHLDFVQARDGGIRIRVIGSPAGDGAEARFEAPGIEGEVAILAEAAEARAEAERAGRGEEAVERLSAASLRALGAQLFDRLIAGEVRSLYDESVGRLGESGDGLRIELRLPVREKEIAGLHALPWELLTRLERDHPLGLDRRFSIVRYLPQARAARPPLPERLRILCASASPSGSPPLDLEREMKEIGEALGAGSGKRSGRDSRIDLVPLPHATLPGIRRALVEGEFHVLHFLGHGAFDPESGDGVLYLEDGRGGAEIVRGRQLAEQLLDRTGLRLVFLNACRTARAAAPNPYGGVATALVRAGLPAVIAMQFPITDSAAIAFSEAFYHRIAAGEPIDAAVTEGRLAIVGRKARSLEWGTPVLFLHASDGLLFERKEKDPGRAREPEAIDSRPMSPPPARAPARIGKLAAGLVGTVVVAALVFAAIRIPSWRDARVADPAAGSASSSQTRPTSEVDAAATDSATSAALPIKPPRAPEKDDDVSGSKANEGSGSTDSTRRRVISEDPITSVPPVVREPRVYTARSGQAVYLSEIETHLTADFLDVQGEAFVRISLAPAAGPPVAQVVLAPQSIKVESGGRETSVSVLSIDWSGKSVQVRANPPS